MRVTCLLRKELLSLLKNSKKFYSISFNANFYKSNIYKLTISVSRSYGKACKRNLIRRRIYNLLHNKYNNVYLWIRINSKHINTTYEQIVENINLLHKYINKLNNY